MFHKMSEYMSQLLVRIFGSRNERLIKELLPLVQQIDDLEPFYMRMTDEQLHEQKQHFKQRLEAGETLDDLLPHVFAAVREAARRILRMRHFGVQMIGGIVLHQGKIAEMVTGEGKTLVATLAASLNALAGHVHVVTVNDYLAQRDRNWMGPVYNFLGLSVGCIQSPMMSEERIPEYQCDITYGTNNEFGFDYLRDNMKMTPQDQCQGPLTYAVIDEVDSVLIDEARTPLIISGPSEESTERYYKAKKVADKLQKGPDYEVKEKEQQVVLTEQGLERAEALVGVDSFYKGKNMEWPHFIEQALRAKELFKKDREYIVQETEDGKAIMIVDEFTGRLMPGRRWSEGLHQAIEAKEGLEIQEENQTLATITFQNFFRLYDKISGMTGTALTEAVEFDKIYNLDVVVVPTNRPLIRLTHDDVIYQTEREKFHAIVEEIWHIHRTGRPLLVGTISIEKSELLSQMLKQRGVEHEVLNAKYHEREAQIIAKAGQLGNVTIATNMAGRGTDIILGTFTEEELLKHWARFNLAPRKLQPRDPQVWQKLQLHWAKVLLNLDEEQIASLSPEELQARIDQYWIDCELRPLRLWRNVADMGGLYILGTERHDARRIDNQLRGRAGRQGDPGSSRFFLSLEDDLMRKFAPQGIANLLSKLGLRDGQEIRHPWISSAIAKAQRKVEAFNFDIRKSLLEFDGVMDEQRKIVYKQRQEVLLGQRLKEMVWEMIEDCVYTALNDYLPANSPARWDLSELCQWCKHKFTVTILPEELQGKDYRTVEALVLEAVRNRYDLREQEIGADTMRELERFILLVTIDSKWKDHLRMMDLLKSGINLEAYGGKDPKIEYKRRGYQLFDELVEAIKEEVTDMIFKLEFELDDMHHLDDLWNPSNFTHQELQALAAMEQEIPPPVTQIRRNQPKVGRNAPCPCGSGKKYKRCCGANA